MDQRSGWIRYASLALLWCVLGGRFALLARVAFECHGPRWIGSEAAFPFTVEK